MQSGEYGSPSMNVHSSAMMQAYSLSLRLEQNDQVFGEFPTQHPGTVVIVGAGGCVVTAGGGVGGLHASGSSVGIHEHTPLYSQVPSVSKSEQNELVIPEYPAQHPTSGGVGAGGAVLVVVNSHSVGSSVTIQSQLAADVHALSSSKLLQNRLYGASPVQQPSPEWVGAGG